MAKGRAADAKITASWPLLQRTCQEAIDNPGVPLTLDNYRGVTFYREKSILFIRLPSGRSICYWNPRVRERKKTVLKFPDGAVEPEENFADGPAVEAMIVAGQCERIHKHPVREIRIDGKVDKSSYLDMRTGQLLREDDANANGLDFMHYVGSCGGKRVDGWGEKVLYGGLICENYVQGAAYDIQAMPGSSRNPVQGGSTFVTEYLLASGLWTCSAITDPERERRTVDPAAQADEPVHRRSSNHG